MLKTQTAKQDNVIMQSEAVKGTENEAETAYELVFGNKTKQSKVKKSKSSKKKKRRRSDSVDSNDDLIMSECDENMDESISYNIITGTALNNYDSEDNSEYNSQDE